MIAARGPTIDLEGFGKHRQQIAQTRNSLVWLQLRIASEGDP